MFIAPMLLDQQEKPFSDTAYVFEPKIDGHRLIIAKNGNETRLFTRHKNECTRQYPELWNVPVDGDVVLDGEVCCTDPDSGNIAFELVMDRFQLKKADKIKTFSEQRPVHCIVWDIMFYQGRDLRSLPLMKRRSILESALKPNQFYSIVPQIEERGEDLYKSIVERKLEGMVAKKKDSKYVSRRSHDWMKVINYQYEEVYLAGYRKDEYGWLAHVEENGIHRPVGIIRLDGSPKQKQAFYTISKQLIIGEDEKFVYLDPRIKARVKFRNWTRHGMLRDPVLVECVI
jgi:DNA ligase-1